SGAVVLTTFIVFLSSVLV
ncbi:DUF3948 family protein, partial [Bacillus wiedmannii]